MKQTIALNSDQANSNQIKILVNVGKSGPKCHGKFVLKFILPGWVTEIYKRGMLYITFIVKTVDLNSFS